MDTHSKSLEHQSYEQLVDLLEQLESTIDDCAETLTMGHRHQEPHPQDLEAESD